MNSDVWINGQCYDGDDLLSTIEDLKITIKEIESLKQQNKLLIEALEFYAYEGNWQDTHKTYKPEYCKISIKDREEVERYGGRKAREVLEKIKEVK